MSGLQMRPDTFHAWLPAWEKFGIEDRMGYSFIDGHMHCMLPQSQWPELEAFVDKFLLGKDVPTDVQVAPMFEDVDLDKWINW